MREGGSDRKAFRGVPNRCGGTTPRPEGQPLHSSQGQSLRMAHLRSPEPLRTPSPWSSVGLSRGPRATSARRAAPGSPPQRRDDDGERWVGCSDAWSGFARPLRRAGAPRRYLSDTAIASRRSSASSHVLVREAVDGAHGRACPIGRDPLVIRSRGDVAEWLRSGLQIRVRRFDSGRRLQRAPHPSPFAVGGIFG